jgi:hypothetical protein
MCVLAIWMGVDPETPLLVGANRDEALDRPSAPPHEIEPGIVAGKDLAGGGTWLGINARGLLVAVTNRRRPARSPDAWSRGLLALEALRCATLDDVAEFTARRVREKPIAGFNLAAVEGARGLCLHWDGSLRPVPFGIGLHVLSTDRDLDDPALPEKALFDRVRGLPDEGGLKELLRSHEGDRPVCKHGDRFGTVSSAIYARTRDGHRLLYAAGPPCRAPFVDFSSALASSR